VLIFTPLELLKAGTKFLAKWRDKNGNWRYRYKALAGPKLSYSEVPSEVFVKTRDSMMPKKYSAFVTLYTAEEYEKKGAKTYVSPNGHSGYALTKEGDLVSVFSKPGSKSGMELMKTAIKNGAKTLDCIGPFLPEFYASYGFEEYDRLEWDDQYAPPNWNYAEFGRPDVVMMRLARNVMKSKRGTGGETTEAFKKLSMDFARDFFGDEFVDEVLRKKKLATKQEEKKVKKSILYLPSDLLKAIDSGAPRRWKDGRLHAKRGGVWVVVAEKGRSGKAAPQAKKKIMKPTQVKAAAKPTMRSINEYFKQNYGQDYDIHKGNGYFYFTGPSGQNGFPQSVMVNSLVGFDMDFWKESIDYAMEEAGVSKKTAGEVMKDAASIQAGVNLPVVESYSDVPDPPPVNAADRNRLNASVRAAVPENYYPNIPMDQLREAMKMEGYVPLQEDGTEWAGMFLGSEGETFIPMGKLSEGRMLHGLATYKPVSNSGLRMTWYEMPSGKYEIVKYIT
jgi:hypothetical protein